MPRPTREPPKRSAQSYCVWLLSRREYAAKELLDKLVQRGYPREAAEAAVTWCQSHGLQSDTRFAENRARSQARRLGDRRVSAGLVEKGIAREVAAQQLEELQPEADRAAQVVQRFEGRALDEALKAKVWRFLAYRGFSGNAIKAALQHLKAVASGEAVE